MVLDCRSRPGAHTALVGTAIFCFALWRRQVWQTSSYRLCSLSERLANKRCCVLIFRERQSHPAEINTLQLAECEVPGLERARSGGGRVYGTSSGHALTQAADGARRHVGALADIQVSQPLQGRQLEHGAVAQIWAALQVEPPEACTYWPRSQASANDLQSQSLHCRRLGAWPLYPSWKMLAQQLRTMNIYSRISTGGKGTASDTPTLQDKYL